MASTTALFTGLTGLNANARQLDVVGNNIANVNTTAYKSTRLMFSNMFSRTYHEGTPPGDTTGGTNPFQIGLGVGLAGTQRNMNAGTISATGDGRDLALDGAGFFVVDRNGGQHYTRAGAFRLNAENVLTNISGDRVLGYGVDEEFNVQGGELLPIAIPVGQLTIAQPTRLVRMAGNLDADGSLPTGGARLTLGRTAAAGLSAIAGATPPPGPGNVLEATTRLVDVEAPASPGSGTPLFAAGQTLELRNVLKGTRLIPTTSFDVTATTTVQQMLDFIAQSLGIDTTAGVNPDGNTPGVTLDPATGILSVVGNTGVANDITIDGADLRLLNADGSVAGYPFVPTKLSSADGESVRTTFVVYDTLGTPVELDVTLALTGRATTGTTWRYTVESGDNAGAALGVASGEITFDNEGRLDSGSPAPIVVDRSDSGAVTPLTFSLEFGGAEDSFTALTDTESAIAASFRDGAPIGTLSGYSVGADGAISGSFSNGLVRTLGQLPLATFANPEGLVDDGSNLFSVGADSGPPIIATPGQFGTGQIVAGALELSNVDIGEEFIKLILSSTGYSASSRVIRTADELMQQLLVLGR